MKGPNPNKTNALRLWFLGRGFPLEEGGVGLGPFLDAIETHAGELMPTLAYWRRKRRYSRANVEKALAESADELCAFAVLERPGSPHAEYHLDLYRRPSPTQCDFHLTVRPLSYFEESEHAEERSRRVIELSRAWAARYPVTHGYVHGQADSQLAPFWDIQNDEERLRNAPHLWVQTMFWLNVLGRELVDGLGRARVLSTPAHLVEELPNGNVLLLTRPTVADHTSEEARQAQARALVHLRQDLRLDEVLCTLRERSAALAPVEMRFDPDIAPLLERVLDHVQISERPRRTAELNAHRPPEPEEWLPAGAAPPSDVANPEAARDRYDELAEDLVVILHSRVPSVFGKTLESLLDIDHWLWLENFPEFYEREKVDAQAVPAVGGYLGEVLVQRLGGRWVPRRELFETQVVVGDRAWLPFLRARRYMQSRQSLLDYSLTQLYRVAERHRARS